MVTRVYISAFFEEAQWNPSIHHVYDTTYRANHLSHLDSDTPLNRLRMPVSLERRIAEVEPNVITEAMTRECIQVCGFGWLGFSFHD